MVRDGPAGCPCLVLVILALKVLQIALDVLVDLLEERVRLSEVTCALWR